MIFCKELNKNFEDKEIMFAELLANKEFIIKEKTSNILKSIDKGIAITSNQEAILKAIETNKELNIDKDFYYFVVNSSNILDSHGDMHVKGNWDKTVKEQQKKTYLVFDHQLKRSEIIAMKEDIEMLTLEIPFSLIGKNYDGNTYALVYKVHKDKIRNKEAKELLESNYSFEASVRMRYIKIDLAMDSSLKENAKEKENFDKYFNEIANKEDFETITHFWIVKEAKNEQESSLVMFGSNPATGLINENKEADTITSSKDEPLQDTQDTQASNNVAKRKLSII
jgi:hypothetical protein